MSGHTPGDGQKAWPGVWTNSVCGHPQEGETLEQAMVRRCRYEVGVDIIDITPIAPGFRYRETDPSGIVENEICPVFAAQIVTPLNINTEEVMEYQWVNLMPSSALWLQHPGHLVRGWCWKQRTPTRNSDSLPPASGNKKAPCLHTGAF
jgi:isopentenyl-diphosphate delta-isomerase type 1